MRITDWIARRIVQILAIAPARAREVDLIFCFAGRKSRKLYALDLFSRGLAPQLILSTGRFELRRYPDLPGVPPADLLAVAASVTPALRHYFVLIQNGAAYPQRIPIHRLGTYSEVLALSAWLSEHPEIQSVAAISSASHLRRIRRCWRALVPYAVKVEFVATPGEGNETVRDLLAEIGKFLLYSAVLAVQKVIA